MTAPRLLLAALALATTGAPASAKLLASFRVQYAAADSSHIVVTDGTGVVLESWFGDLRPGDRLPGVVFAGVVLDRPIGRWSRTEGGPERMTGNRLVWFLRRTPGGWAPARGDIDRLGRFEVSMAWSERGRVYGLVQLQNPGGLEVSWVAANEDEFHMLAADFAARGARFREAAAEPDPGRRAAMLAPFLAADSIHVYRAIPRLTGCGPAGVKPLAGVAADPKRRDIHPVVIRALGAIGPPAAEVLSGILREEQRYWMVATERGITEGWVKDPEHVYHKERLVAALTWGTPFAYPTEEQRMLIWNVCGAWKGDPILRRGAETNEGQQQRGRDGLGHPVYLALRVTESWDWWPGPE